MTFEDTRQEIYVANIVAGRVWEGRPNFASDSNVTASTIQARLEFRTAPGEPVLVSCATSGGGTADGTITITQLGVDGDLYIYEAYCYLSDAVTQEALGAYAGIGPTRGQVGWGDLKLWAPSVNSGAAYDGGLFELRVEAEVTA